MFDIGPSPIIRNKYLANPPVDMGVMPRFSPGEITNMPVPDPNIPPRQFPIDTGKGVMPKFPGPMQPNPPIVPNEPVYHPTFIPGPMTNVMAQPNRNPMQGIGMNKPMGGSIWNRYNQGMNRPKRY